MIKRKTIEIGGVKVKLKTPSMMAYLDQGFQREMMLAVLCEVQKDDDGNPIGYLVPTIIARRVDHILQIIISTYDMGEGFPLEIPDIQDGVDKLIEFYHELEDSDKLGYWDMKKLIDAAQFVCEAPGDPEVQPPNPS
jgi:hypothetical protein